MSHGYPHGKRHVRFHKKPGKNGLQAEVNPALPHVVVPHDGAIVECSTELAWRLVEKGRAEIVNVASEASTAALQEPAAPVIGSDDTGGLTTHFRRKATRKSKGKPGPLG